MDKRLANNPQIRLPRLATAVIRAWNSRLSTRSGLPVMNSVTVQAAGCPTLASFVVEDRKPGAPGGVLGRSPAYNALQQPIS